MQIPPYLKKGDKVAIVCTASSIRGGIDQGINILESWGLTVQVEQSVSSRLHTFAGSDELRQADLQKVLDDPTIKAVFAARGGYGTIRIIDKIDFTAFAESPKWLIGFSDITVLHSHIQRQLGTPTIHGQMPKTLETGSKKSIETLKNALFGQNIDVAYQYRGSHNRSGHAEGVLVGGNLALLHALVGSASDIDYTDKVLFIEDVGEPHYNIDRMLWTLKRAGKLDPLNGLVVGGFTALEDTKSYFGQSVEEIILEKVHGLGFPVAFGFPAGHIDNNYALMFGKKVNLAVEKNKVSLTYTT